MALESYANAPTLSSPTAAWTTLNGAILAGDTSLVVASAASFPSSGQFRILIGDELMLVTAVVGTTFTVTRGAESTTAAGHANGASVFHTLTAASLLRSPGAMTSTGDLQYLNSSGAPARLAVGTDGQYLRYASSLPTASALLMSDLSGSGIVYSTDTTLARTGLGTMKLTSSSASSSLGVQNGSNVEFGAIGWDGSNSFVVGTQGGVGAGTARDTILGSATGATNGLYLATEGTSRWQVTATGLLRPFTDNTIAIGDASHRVSNLYAALTNATGLPISTGVSGLGTGVATFLATPSSANLAAAVTNETGTGVLVFNDTPTLIAPLLGTPTSGVLSNCTGLPVASLTGLGTGVGTFLATPSSANLIAALTDETGTGACVFANTPTLVTPVLGVATATSLNGNTFTAGTYTLTGVAGKVLTFNKSLTLEGTDSTTMTFPTTSATIARTDAAQTFTGSQTIAALVGPVTITEAVGSSALTLTGATQVSNFPAINLTQTWNASGTAFAGIKVNLTLTAFSSSSVFLELQNAGTRVMAIGPSGQLCGVASNNFGTIYVNGNQTAYTDSVVALGGASAEGVTCRSQGWFAFSSSSSNALHSNKDTIISRGGAAATVQLGLDVNGAAVNQTLWAASGTTGQNRTGGNLTLASGKGTDLGAVSSLIFQTPTVGGATSGTAQALATRLTIDSAGAVFTGRLTALGGAVFLVTSSALTDGVGGSLGTLATAPSAGNPTKWIGINDNGTVRYIPAW